MQGTHPAGSASRRLRRTVLLTILAVSGIVVGLLTMHTVDLGSPHASVGTAVTSMAGGDMSLTTATSARSGDAECGFSCGVPLHEVLTMACLLALLVTLVALARPVLAYSDPRAWFLPRRLPPPSGTAPPTPPSLHLLSISRT